MADVWMIYHDPVFHVRAVAYAYPPGPMVEAYVSEAPYVPDGLVIQLARALLRPASPLEESAGGGGVGDRMAATIPKPSGWFIRYAERELLVTESGYRVALHRLSLDDRERIREWVNRAKRYYVIRIKDGQEKRLKQAIEEDFANAESWREKWELIPLYRAGGPTLHGLSFIRLAALLFPDYTGVKSVRHVA